MAVSDYRLRYLKEENIIPIYKKNIRNLKKIILKNTEMNENQLKI